MKRQKLSAWARENGLRYETAWRLFRAGNLSGIQLPSGTILVDVEVSSDAARPTGPTRAAVYARVSSTENKDNLSSQSERVSAYCAANGYQIVRVVRECGSGVNDQRRKLLALLREYAEWDVLVVEHKDRLTRFGFEYLSLFAESHEKRVEVINVSENDESDLVQDFVSIITSFCARVYGRRRSKRATERLIAQLADEHGEQASKSGVAPGANGELSLT